jgi:hypothetical protein
LPIGYRPNHPSSLPIRQVFFDRGDWHPVTPKALSCRLHPQTLRFWARSTASAAASCGVTPCHSWWLDQWDDEVVGLEGGDEEVVD